MKTGTKAQPSAGAIICKVCKRPVIVETCVSCWDYDAHPERYCVGCWQPVDYSPSLRAAQNVLLAIGGDEMQIPPAAIARC